MNKSIFFKKVISFMLLLAAICEFTFMLRLFPPFQLFKRPGASECEDLLMISAALFAAMLLLLLAAVLLNGEAYSATIIMTIVMGAAVLVGSLLLKTSTVDGIVVRYAIPSVAFYFLPPMLLTYFRIKPPVGKRRPMFYITLGLLFLCLLSAAALFIAAQFVAVKYYAALVLPIIILSNLLCIAGKLNGRATAAVYSGAAILPLYYTVWSIVPTDPAFTAVAVLNILTAVAISATVLDNKK